jgi:neutral ceramidase
MKRFVSICVLLLFINTSPAQSRGWLAGTSAIKITPEKPIPLVGYASRTNAFKTVDQDIYAQGLALQDESGNRALLITADICILSPTVAEPICEELMAKTGLKREQILLSVSHTHSGPWVSFAPSRALNLPESLTNEVVEYTRVFQKKLVEAGAGALAKLAPAKLSFGAGIANFVMNRREFTTNGVILGVNPRGYVDRTVPVLRIDSPEGELRAVLFGYACHGTTLPSDSLIISGDYPGYAREEIRKKFPKADALFVAGLGGSANPYPRTGIDFAKQHGAELAAEVCRVLDSKLRPITGPLTCVHENAGLPLDVLSKEALTETAKTKRWLRGSAEDMIKALERGETLPPSHKAPVSIWQFGSDFTLVALSGEVVGEYVPMIEQAIGPMNLWLAAYCNAVSGYIPARQTLREGGYECRGLYEGLGWYAPEAEKVLVDKVRELARKAGRKQ